MDLYTTAFDFPRPPVRVSVTGNTPSSNTTAQLPGSSTFRILPLPNTSGTTPQTGASSSSTPNATTIHADEEWKAVQDKCFEITSREGCLVTATRESTGAEQGNGSQTFKIDGEAIRPVVETPIYNYHLSGEYGAVVAARGHLLREAPRETRLTIKVSRSDILESPLADVSPVKSDVLSRLMPIALEAQARLSVINFATQGVTVSAGVVLATADGMNPGETEEAWTKGQDWTTQAPGHDRTSSADSSNADSVNGSTTNSSSKAKAKATGDGASNANTEPSGENGKTHSVKPERPRTYGLETERLCEILISGPMENVYFAKLRLLVMLDELAGLHVDMCEIDYKLQPIVAGRLRTFIQNIQEETSTNIYLPTALVGIFDPPPAGIQQGIGYRHLAVPTPPSPMAIQHTGHSMYSMGMNGQGIGMGVSPQMTGNSSMNMTHGGFLHSPHGMHPDHRSQQGYHGQSYDGHSHNHSMSGQGYSSHAPHPVFQYWAEPTPHHGPGQSREMTYNNHNRNFNHNAGMMYGQMNGMGPQHHLTPMQVNHTGVSSMNSFQSSRMNSPMPHHHAQSPMPHHMQIHDGRLHPHHNHHPGMEMQPAMYTGQTHLHAGMAGGPGPMGGRFTNNQGFMGGNMTMNVRPQMSINHFNGPHPGLSIHCGEQGRLGKAHQVWITGEFFGVQRARDMLLNAASQKTNLVISRDAAVVPRKMDWLLTERLDEIRGIMNDNGTYIQVPSVGSQASLITVFGDHRTNVERSIRQIMALTCQFYTASFWLLPMSFDVLMPQASLNPAQMQPVLKQIAHTTGAEIVFKSNCFEMHGLEAQVRAACLMILDLEAVHNFQHEIRFQIEMANEHREFISGKKNGKINKIMKMCGVKIKFETFNDYNFLLDISGNNVGSLQGLSMLLEELPAEISFHLPEAYHKRIIGVGGRNVQRIMKTYGVYVKFSNCEDFAAIGGYHENEDNVVARTPAKNHVNLEVMRQAIVDMINPKDKDYTRETVPIPRRYHRTLQGEKCIFMRDIEIKTSCSIRFPFKETASDLVTIFGPESQAHIAAAMLLEHVPFEADLQVPPNPELTKLVTSPDFVVFSERVKRENQIAITPSAKFGQGDEAVFKFRCQRSNIDFLATAREVLETWLGQHKIQVYPHNAIKRVDNYADAFSHFNSKLFAGGHKNGSAQAPVEDLMPRPRTAVDSSDVKALFEAPGNSSNPGFAGPLGVPWTTAPEFWQPSGPTHVRADTDTVKRDTDQAIPIQDRIRSVTYQVSPHSHRGSARTQSLDMNSLNFARSVSGGSNSFGPMPPSPNGLVSSPNAATGPFFPSSGHHQHTVSSSGRYTVDSITEGLNNVQVTHP